MTLTNKTENLLAEAVKNMLDSEALGDYTHQTRKKDEKSHNFTFLHEEIEQAFRFETIDFDHHEDVCSAFSKIHSHKYIDDPTFALAFKKELTARAVPKDEQEGSIKIIEKLKKKYLDDTSYQKDAGWHIDLDEIVRVSQPEQIGESKEIDIDDIDNFSQERRLFTDPGFRKWVSDKKPFWEAINKRIKPHLEQLGYKADTQNDFWESYDDEAAEMVIRYRMHELYEGMHANYKMYK